MHIQRDPSVRHYHSLMKYIGVMFFALCGVGALMLTASAQEYPSTLTNGTTSTFVDTQPPTTPSLSIEKLTPYSVSLYVTESADNIGVVSYEIYRSDLSVVQTMESFYYDQTALIPGTTIYYKARAKDAAGNLSPWSEPLVVNVPLDTTTSTTTSPNTDPGSAPTIDTLPPAAPSLRIDAVVVGSVMLSFSSVDNIALSGFKLFRNGVFFRSLSSDVRNYADTTGEAGASYVYTVMAIDTTGNTSPLSAPVTATFPPKETAVAPTLVTSSVVPLLDTICENEIPKTKVRFSLSLSSAGDFILFLEGGTSKVLRSGEYALDNGVYKWQVRLSDGYTMSANTTGMFTLSRECPIISTTATPTTPLVVPTVEPAPVATTPESVPTVTPPPPVRSSTPVAPPKTPVSAPAIESRLPEPISAVVTPVPAYASTTFLNCTSTSCRELCLVDDVFLSECVQFARSVVSTSTDFSTETPNEGEGMERERTLVLQRTGARSVVDSDNDGVTDYDEVNIYGTDPERVDSDNDGVDDGAELLARTDPAASSTPDAAVRLPEKPSLETLAAQGVPALDLYAVDGIIVAEVGTTSDGVLTAKRLTFSGRALPNSYATIAIFSDPVVVTVRTSEAGVWEYTLDSELPDGTHHVVVALADAGGRAIARSEPLPFVKRASAVSIGSTELLGGFSEAPGFFTGNSPYLLILVLVVLIILSLSILGLTSLRHDDNDSLIPPSGGAVN